MAGGDHAAASETCGVIPEAPVVIDVADVGTYTVMAYPRQMRPLAVGFLMGEGIIDDIGKIGTLGECADDPSVVRVRLKVSRPAEAP